MEAAPTVSTSAAIVLGIGAGVVIVGPVIGVGVVLLADAIMDWHMRRQT